MDWIDVKEKHPARYRNSHMGIYYYAVDWNEKKIFQPPLDYANKKPGIFHPKNPFPGMFIMKNIQGYNFQIIDDMGWEYEEACTFENITEKVYEEYLKYFPLDENE